MIFDDVYKLPRPNGATDFNDSSHLAGLLAVVEHPEQVPCEWYVVARIVDRDTAIAKYVRHPSESKYDFSRDQFVMLACGLIAQGYNDFVNLDFINGKDILPPSVRGLVRIAQGKKPYFYQTKWLTAEIYWHSYLQPIDEPFQLLAMILTYDKFNGSNELLKLWTSKNNKWRWSILRYLAQLDGAWRGEKELAEHVIKYVEGKLNG